MGFSGGGSNVLKPHTHDGSISQDGGALDMNGVTQGSLTAGDVIYSDGSNLQRLAIGAANQVLEVNGGATAPQWVTTTPGGVTLNNILVETTSQFSSSSSSFVDVTDMDWTASAVSGRGFAVCDSYIQMNGGGGTGYWRWTASVDGDQATQRTNSSSSLGKINLNLPFVTSSLSSQVCKVQGKNDGGNTWYFAVDSEGVSRIQVLEIS